MCAYVKGKLENANTNTIVSSVSILHIIFVLLHILISHSSTKTLGHTTEYLKSFGKLS